VRRTTVVLRAIGALLTVVGIVAAFYGPLEIYVFYFFSDGGRFHYPGFGVGSLWFAALVAQDLAYYILAALLLPVGVGHLRMRQWARSLTELYLWIWLGAGLLLVSNLLLLVPAAGKLPLAPNVLAGRLAAIGAFAALGLLVMPALGLRIYRGARVRAAFDAHDAGRYWTEAYPRSLQALLLLYVAMILVFHLAYFFDAAYPWFGRIVTGRSGAYLLAGSVVLVGASIVGTLRLRPWAWWGTLAGLALLSLSTLLSFTRHDLYDFLALMDLPPFEWAFVTRLAPFPGYRPAALLVPPLWAAIAILIAARPHFGQPSKDSDTSGPLGRGG